MAFIEHEKNERRADREGSKEQTDLMTSILQKQGEVSQEQGEELIKLNKQHNELKKQQIHLEGRVDTVEERVDTVEERVDNMETNDEDRDRKIEDLQKTQRKITTAIKGLGVALPSSSSSTKGTCEMKWLLTYRTLQQI